ncbi:MAG: DEAD/DEAH box helicase family protein, partial [Bifidobacteriaceae bacterium]|nr:DEAD/DEAH box helicase family protein [Bifidobacteriaceae bacterium]
TPPFDEYYDQASALYLPDLFGWLYDTQPEQLAKLVKPGGLDRGHGAGSGDGIGGGVSNVLGEYAAAADRIRGRAVKLLSTDPMAGGGTLNVLKSPVDVTPARLSLFQPRPATPLNPELNDRYLLNRLRVMRQVHYSTKNENSLDLVLFLNGIPVATIELKTELTQSLQAGLRQYARDRRPVGEPLLEFGRGALVHFVVTEEWVRMTTKLDSANTKFLPFDRGRAGGEGNPPIEGTAPTAYLWQEILQRDTFLDLIGRFAHYRFDERVDVDGAKTVDRALRFPRYHQWRAVTKLERAALDEGPGHNYLIQHSAGSGKTDSIAWAAHRLATLHRPDSSKVFDGVIVVSDRRVLDGQLSRAVASLQSKAGMFVSVSHEQSNSKAKQLTEALTKGEAIIGVTLQTFPFALEILRDSPALAARNYAVIADEAHSSQSGDAAKKLREVLAGGDAPGPSDDEPDAQVDSEDLLASVMAARADQTTISFFAFTATPKGKTLELFGTPGPSGKPEPFDLYSMKQAIEEGFILDVLQNYMTYDLALRLSTKDDDGSTATVDTGQANAQIMRWVRLHPHNIAQKVQVIVNHYLNVVAGELGGRAKAMVVTGSRKEAVRYKIAIDKYLADNGLAGEYSALVAFSGTVHDPESGPGEFCETTMNPRLSGRALEDAFAGDEFQVMIVANKFQTGFDQPLLVAMYVDKKLSGITAVQTLSRLNRVIPGKANTYVLDFVNDPDAILAAFQDYYEDAVLYRPSDPDIVHDMLAKIKAVGIIDTAEITPVVEEVVKQGSHTKLYGMVKTSRDRFYDRLHAARVGDDDLEKQTLADFRATINNFVRAYDFLSQIINYENLDIEKWSVFFKVYRGAIRDDEPRDEVDTSGLVMTHYKLIRASEGGLKLSAGQQGQLSGVTAVGSGGVRATKYGLLEEVLQRINDLFAGSALDEVDRANAFLSISNHAINSSRLQAEAMANSESDFASSPSIIEELEDIPYRADVGHQAAIKYLVTTGKYRQLAEALLAQGLYEALRRAAQDEEADE